MVLIWAGLSAVVMLLVAAYSARCVSMLPTLRPTLMGTPGRILAFWFAIFLAHICAAVLMGFSFGWLAAVATYIMLDVAKGKILKSYYEREVKALARNLVEWHHRDFPNNRGIDLAELEKRAHEVASKTISERQHYPYR